jgi:hypothetical protein
MMGKITFWYSYALNFPRKRSADFHTSLARLSSLGLLRESDTVEEFSIVGVRILRPPERLYLYAYLFLDNLGSLA